LDRDKIRRFLEGVNRGLEVSLRRLQAEREYLQRLATHLPLLANAIGQLREGMAAGQQPEPTPISDLDQPDRI
jgi:hypothetical protein